MRKLLLLTLILASQQAFACISVASNARICNGDTVFKGATYDQGAIVVGENSYTQQVTVRSIFSGMVTVENARDLDVITGCYGQFCVGDNVFKGDEFTQGATIVGINYSLQTLTVKSIINRKLFVERAEQLYGSNGCLENVCVGELVYKGAEYGQGAIVVGINNYKHSLTVKSVVTGKLFVEVASDVDLIKGCLGSVCIGDRVFKGAEYRQGATVLAINYAGYRATVKSVSTGKLFSESIYELQGGSNNPYPQQPPIPQEPPRPPRPTGPQQPPRPPTPSYEQCKVNRLDPSGLLVASYTKTGYTKGEACRAATDDCSRDLRGRQTCNISR